VTGTAIDSLDCRRILPAGGRDYGYYSLEAAAAAGLGDLSRLPVSLKVLLENLLRHEDGDEITVDDMQALVDRRGGHDIAFHPARILTHDLSGIPILLDMAAMREAVQAMGGDPRRIDPVRPVDLVMDHSVIVDHFGSPDALERNMAAELARNRERYAFLDWARGAFGNLRVAPPGAGICHQVNLEHLARVVTVADRADGPIAHPDTVLGADSHTPMVNALGVLGWGVGGIEAMAALMGEPASLRVPDVIGVVVTGRPAAGVTATDIVLTLTERLRGRGVVGTFLEFCGPGLDHLPLPDRATIANMAPEYGATCAFFPIDSESLRYLAATGRETDHLALVEAYARAQGLWRDPASPTPEFNDTVAFDLGSVEPCVAGPSRPQDRVPLGRVATAVEADLADGGRADDGLRDGSVAIAAITSCTNTANPGLLVGAGLLARNARRRGITVKPWVKTSLTPGSRVVADLLRKSGLQDDLDALGFHVAGFGCATCSGNSGPLTEAASRAAANGARLAAVLSGNRNFEGRVHPQIASGYLASPALVVAYAIAGAMSVDLVRDPLGHDRKGRPVRLADIWPSAQEIAAVIDAGLDPGMFRRRYAEIFAARTDAPSAAPYPWDPASLFIRRPPFAAAVASDPPPVEDIVGARALVVLGDDVTTDHISPVGAIAADSPAGRYLGAQGVAAKDFGSYGARRGDHEVMMRGLFANPRLRNELVGGIAGGVTRHMPDGDLAPVFDVAARYAEAGVPMTVVAGRNYGAGSSRDWAAKGAKLVGIRAVIAESFERIHRSNLVSLGVLPLQFMDGATRADFGLDGSEFYDISDVAGGLSPRMTVTCRVRRGDATIATVPLLARLDTTREAAYYRHGGLMPYLIRAVAAAKP